MLINKKKYYFLLLNIFIIICLLTKKNILIKYKEYISKSKMLIKINNNKSLNYNNPFISVCLPAYNMEKYIERSLISIINQSFKNFEIVVVNDYSEDQTINIIQRLQSEDNRIKVINHNKNLGVYYSRIESILYSKGEYILLMDPDDMIINQNLFEELFFHQSMDLIIIIDLKKKLYINLNYLIFYSINQTQIIIQ